MATLAIWRTLADEDVQDFAVGLVLTRPGLSWRSGQGRLLV